jgi:hypothetical protein
MKKPKTIEYNPAHLSHGYVVRWVENVSEGLRFVGFADEILKHLRHQGWYTNEDFQDEVYRGAVYQLPASKGETRFVYGYADPNNEDCALVCFDTQSDKAEAARDADRMAEIFAEAQRDWAQAANAGNEYLELANEIKSKRKEALAIAGEIRAARKTAVLAPTICGVARRKVLSLYQSIQEDRAKRKELLSNYGRLPGFADQ